jgi:hypothetical protein
MIPESGKPVLAPVQIGQGAKLRAGRAVHPRNPYVGEE